MKPSPSAIFGISYIKNKIQNVYTIQILSEERNKMMMSADKEQKIAVYSTLHLNVYTQTQFWIYLFD